MMLHRIALGFALLYITVQAIQPLETNP